LAPPYLTMTPLETDLLATKLHVSAAGEVWAIVADGAPINSGLSIIQFLISAACARAGFVRMIGNHANAQLLMALSDGEPRRRIEVCSPLVCPTAGLRSTPQMALYAMRRCNAAPRLGGWHVFGRNDRAAYALASYLQKVGKIDDTAMALLRVHPAWPAMSFIPHLNLQACSHLLSTILDPRWYTDRHAPNRSSKLRAFLGLTMANARAMVGAEDMRRWRGGLYTMVADCWSWPKDLHRIEAPPYFLYRIFRKLAGDSLAKAVLRTSQKFIDFVWLAWLDAVRPAGAKPAFIPERFFHPQEAEAFSAHLASLR